MKRLGPVAGFVFVALSAGVANAAGFYCPRTRSYVVEGQSTAEVQSACGPPTTKERQKGLRGRVTERWTYDLGPGYLVRLLVFHNGWLVLIEEGGYGRSR